MPDDEFPLIHDSPVDFARPDLLPHTVKVFINSSFKLELVPIISTISIMSIEFRVIMITWLFWSTSAIFGNT
jgi:hypothetical protein